MCTRNTESYGFQVGMALSSVNQSQMTLIELTQIQSNPLRMAPDTCTRKKYDILHYWWKHPYVCQRFLSFEFWFWCVQIAFVCCIESVFLSWALSKLTFLTFIFSIAAFHSTPWTVQLDVIKWAFVEQSKMHLTIAWKHF